MPSEGPSVAVCKFLKQNVKEFSFWFFFAGSESNRTMPPALHEPERSYGHSTGAG